MAESQQPGEVFMSKKRAFLIGAGEIGTERPVIEEKDMVIALDGGLVFCVEQGIEPDLILGDFDSLLEEHRGLLKAFPDEKILRLPTEKDDTDMVAAIKFAIEKGVEEFVIYGGMGGRVSHTLANIQCLAYLKERGLSGKLVGENKSVCMLHNETCIFDKKQQGYLSVFAYSGHADGVTLRNLKYELTDAVLTDSFPLGVSNEFVGEEAEITVKDGTLLVITEKM